MVSIEAYGSLKKNLVWLIMIKIVGSFDINCTEKMVFEA
jgi:hypothetical protein